jgi:endonuclease YncB( thermonuclease family)
VPGRSEQANGIPNFSRWGWAIATLALFASSDMPQSDDLTGQASIIDGDTLEIHGTRIRIWGIDAPESTQL